MVKSAEGCVIEWRERAEYFQQENEYLRTENQVLKEQLAILKLKVFGSSSEKKTDMKTGMLFPEDDVPRVDSASAKQIKVGGYTRRRGGRKPLSDKLPREERIIDLSDEEKTCSHCNTFMEKIGEDISERAELIPPKIYVEKVIRPKYVCRACKKPPVGKELPYVLPHSIAGNGLLAHIAVSKFCDAIPFHRLEGILSRYGIEYSKANMCNNMLQFHESYGEKIMALLEKKALESNMLHIDETGLQVLREANRSNKKKSYVWAFMSTGNSPVVLYMYRPSRSADFLLDFLSDYKGVVLTDGYSAYDQVFGKISVEHAGCHVHARRYFHKAVHVAKDARAAPALEYYRKLYRVERFGRSKGYTNKQLAELRQKESKPVLRKFYKWLLKQRPQIRNSKSAFAKAVNYTINQWPKLTLFLGNGDIPLDNNAIENRIRPFVIGRKNWLFSGSPRGADAACMFYSLLETAKANGHEPYWYLRNLFNHLPAITSETDLEELMPYNLRPQTGSA